MKNNLEYRRRLPPELLVEMHKCLPLANAIYVLVNVSKTFVLNNSARMLRIKTSLNEYIDELVENGGQNNGNELRIENNNVEWKPQLNALLRYGAWMTSTPKLFIGQKDLSCIRRIGSSIVGHPENFVPELILHLANSRSPQLVLQSAEMNLERAPLPTFLKPLLNEKNYQWIVPGRYLRDKSFELKAEDGQTLSIFDAELRQYYDEKYELRIILVNKEDRKYWFEISMAVDSAKKFIRRLEFTKWKMEPLDENGQFELSWLTNYQIEENGCKLEAKQNIEWNSIWDLVMRRGAGFTQYRHFNATKEFDFSYYYCDDYSAFWINYISETKHPEELLETIDIKMGLFLMSFFIDKIWKICHKGIPEGGNVFKVEGKKLHILSAKTAKAKCRKGKIIQEKELELTLANIPTNGQYVFDIAFQFQYARPDRIIGIKIKKRKRKRAYIDDEDEDEDGPMCSSKIMKK